MKQTKFAFPNVHVLFFSLLPSVNYDVKGDAKGIASTTYILKDTEQRQNLNMAFWQCSKKAVKAGCDV